MCDSHEPHTHKPIKIIFYELLPSKTVAKLVKNDELTKYFPLKNVNKKNYFLNTF